MLYQMAKFIFVCVIALLAPHKSRGFLLPYYVHKDLLAFVPI